MENIEVKRLPLGLTPKWIRQEERLKEVKEAMLRYFNAGKEIPSEWSEEYEELIEALKSHPNGTKEN